MSKLLSLLTTLRHTAFCCELALMAFLSAATVGVCLPGELVVELDESAWPAESEDENQEGEEESVVQSPRRLELRRQHTLERVRIARGRRTLCLSRPVPPDTKAGHRLPNGLMAPPRC